MDVRRLLFWLFLALAFPTAGCAAKPPPDGDVAASDSSAARRRLAEDAAAGQALVAHVVVALCDNLYQGIVPVPRTLGNGQEPRTNLYWGAMFGLKTYLRKAGWSSESRAPPRPEILERLILKRSLSFGDRPATVYVVADAWDGREMRSAVEAFLAMAAGHEAETLTVHGVEVEAGGRAHLVAFVGHNGLMDFYLEPADAPGPAPEAPARSSIVLACASQLYFLPHLSRGGSYPLLLTTGLMAPEAYTLDAVLTSWFGGEDVSAVHESAAAAYHRYQKCGMAGARQLFWVGRGEK